LHARAPRASHFPPHTTPPSSFSAKNLILMGIKHCELYDPAPTSWLDLSGQFYLTPEDVGHPRAARCLARLQALNQYVTVAVAPEAALSAAVLARFSVIVATDCSEAELAALGGWARAGGRQFIAAEARGGFGRVFTDLGPAHTVEDADGQPLQSGVLAMVTADEVGAVSCVQDARHGLSVGDHVVFREVTGCAGLNDGVPRRVQSVPDAGTFTLGDLRGCGGAYTGGGTFTTVKVPTQMAFAPVTDMLRPVGTPGGPPSEAAFSVTDFAKFDRPAVLHSAFCALHAAGIPAPGDEAAAQGVLAAAEGLCAGAAPPQALTPALRALILQLARGAAGSLSPMCAAIGGIAGQEVIKGITRNFTPLRQWLYLDASEAVPPGSCPPPLPPSALAPRGDRYDGQAAVIGRAAQAALGGLRYFLVGAGAIGCEVLKTWALMGVGCGPGGAITVTDMDTIERSNLSRQFLFRAADIGRLKSTTAVNAAVAMNASLRAVAYEARVGDDNEGVFNAGFWGGLAGVCTALDNVDARLYIDRCCLKYRVPMLDSGTQGTMGSTQVVYPDLTENYGARRDPPEVGIPICTLKDFPYKIEHTLAWARDWFEGEFKQLPEAVNAYLSQPNFLEALKAQTNTQIETLKKVRGGERVRCAVLCVCVCVCARARVCFYPKLNLLPPPPAPSPPRSCNPRWCTSAPPRCRTS
jgi:ubiquitin-activating enzyme E1